MAEPRLETRAPDGQVLLDYDRYSTGAALALGADLERALGTAADFTPQARALYAADASNYRQVPIGVVYPRSRDEVAETARTCREQEAPMIGPGRLPCRNRPMPADTANAATDSGKPVSPASIGDMPSTDCSQIEV